MTTNAKAYGKVEHWQRMLRKSPALVRAASKALAEATLELIDEGFVAEADPYGKRWAPKARPDGRKVLTGKTRRLRRRWRAVRVDKSGFHVIPGVDYAAAHQAPRYGRRPRRMMVPDSRRGLPARWRKRFKQVAGSQFKKYLR